MNQQETLTCLDVLEPGIKVIDAPAWPAQAELILSALEAGQYAGQPLDRRGCSRRRLKVQASLRLFIDGPSTPPWTLYTRDVHPRGLGFITPHRLPLGYGGMLDIPSIDGTFTVACTLLRCREAAPGWFEGSLYFNRDQEAFAL